MVSKVFNKVEVWSVRFQQVCNVPHLGRGMVSKVLARLQYS